MKKTILGESACGLGRLTTLWGVIPKICALGSSKHSHFGTSTFSIKKLEHSSLILRQTELREKSSNSTESPVRY